MAAPIRCKVLLNGYEGASEINAIHTKEATKRKGAMPKGTTPNLFVQSPKGLIFISYPNPDRTEFVRYGFGVRERRQRSERADVIHRTLRW